MPANSRIINPSPILKNPTGFKNPELVDISYNPTDRTVTITGTVEAYFNGNRIATIYDGYVSPAHDSASGQYFFYHDGTNFVWSTTPWSFNMIMIAMAYRDTANFCLRECHGLMPAEAHQELHETTGTYLVSGGDMSNFVLNSTTAANRRPYISSALVADEDLRTTNPALTTNSYTWLYLTSTNTANFSYSNADIINLSGNQPYYNQFTGGAWTQTLFANNEYAKIFVMALPTTSNVECQRARYVFIQPQTTSGTLSTIQAITPVSANLGHISGALAEYVFIGEIIVRYTGGNWRIIEANKLTGTRKSQTVTQAGTFLSSVITDATLTGQGTSASPLSVVGANDEQVRRELAFSQVAKFNELIYSSGKLVQVNIWEDATKTIKLWEKQLVYTGDKLTSIVVTRQSDSYTYTKTLAYTGDVLDSVETIE